MFYLKTDYEGKTIEVDIYGDEIYTKCFNCGKEWQIDKDLLIDILINDDISSTQVACCTSGKPQLIRIK